MRYHSITCTRPCDGDWCDCWCHEKEADDVRARMEALIERSSLGTPEAKALRDSVPQEVVDRILARVRELEADDAETD